MLFSFFYNIPNILRNKPAFSERGKEKKGYQSDTLKRPVVFFI